MKPIDAAALAACLCLASPAGAQTTLLTDVTIVDVETGGLLEGASLLIQDGVIAEVGDANPPGDAVVVDGGGGFLIPGL